MHLEDAANTLALAFCRVLDIGTGFECTGIDTEETKLTNIRICHNLEC